MDVDERERLAIQFQRLRPRLLAVAYRMLGSVADGEDVVQDAWVRLQRAADADPTRPIEDVAAWLITTVARLALDQLRTARVTRTAYVGPWLPEPWVDVLPATDPADRVSLVDQVSLALLVVLESLSPAERAVFVLHDTFGMPFGDVADVVARTPAACRQLASRARKHVQGLTPRADVDAGAHKRALLAFLAAASGGDLEGLARVLDPSVVYRTDGGGVVGAARRVVVGADRVARVVIGVTAKHYDAAVTDVQFVAVNGLPGALLRVGGVLCGVISLVVADERVTEVNMLLNPDKLALVERQLNRPEARLEAVHELLSIDRDRYRTDIVDVDKFPESDRCTPKP
jgi:RNA polymerase sigma-70 factor, ECF subfamily